MNRTRGDGAGAGARARWRWGAVLVVVCEHLLTSQLELVRLRRRGMLIAWFGLTALFAIMIDTIMFSTAADGVELPLGAPGVAFPTTAELASPDGLMAGMPAAASMFGIVTLSFWAIAVATGYSSGLIRLLVAAMPRRWPLLVG